MKPKNFDELSVYYLEPFEYKSIGNWARQLMMHMPKINKVAVEKPIKSLKRSYAASGMTYFDWFKDNFYEMEIDLMLMSESLNYLPMYTMFREYFKALPTVMFIHCTEMDFPKVLRSQSSLWGELGTMTVVDRVHFFSDFSKRITLQRGKEYLSDNLLELIEKKSRVVPLPIHLKDLDSYNAVPEVREKTKDIPILMYNHRLDPDKGYLIFLKALDAIHDKGIPFYINLCAAPSSSSRDPLIKKYLDKWGEKVLHYGLVYDRYKYSTLLHHSDIVINSCEEVMGISMIEAAYCGCWPIVFNDGALPDLFQDYCDKFKTVEELVAVLEHRLQNPKQMPTLSRITELDWSYQTDRYKASWYEVYENKMRMENLTGAMDKVIEELRKRPLTKKEMLHNVLGWGSFDFWPIYRYRMLSNGISSKNHTIPLYTMDGIRYNKETEILDGERTNLQAV